MIFHVLILVFLLSFVPRSAFAECLSKSNLSFSSDLFSPSVMEALKKRQIIGDINFKYEFGPVSKSIGDARMYALLDDEGNLEAVRIDGGVDVLGYGISLKKTLYMSELQTGSMTKFYVDGVDEPFATIRPSADFGPGGGELTFELKGEEGTRKKFTLSVRNVADRWRVLRTSDTYYEYIDEVTIYGAGHSLGSLAVSKVHFK